MKADGGKQSGARSRWWIVGVLLGAIAVSGALVVTVGERGGGSSPGEGRERKALAGARSTWHHEFPEAHAGDVWITVDAGDGTARTVTVIWGEWERRISHTGSGPSTYVFTKNPGPTVPTTVKVEPAALVTFGTGTPPAGAEDVNDGWTRAT